MVKAIDNLVTDAPLRDIRLAIGPAEALLRDPQDPVTDPETTGEEEAMVPAPEPVGKEQLLEHEQAGYQRCLLYTSPSPRDKRQSRMPSSA